MRVLAVLSVVCFAALGGACSESAPGLLGASFLVFIPPPGDATEYTIAQGGETDFEIGTAELHYEVQMKDGFSSSDLVIDIADFPQGVQMEPSIVESVTSPFSLEPNDVRNGHFAIRADASAVPGIYEVTMTVTGTVEPGGASQTQSDTFVLTIVERQDG